MEQVRFGIVGLGNMGLKHAQIMLRDVQEVRLAAVASRNAANIAQLRAMEGGAQVRVFDTLEQMAQSGEIDAVLIASPHRAHVAQAVQAFARGMHVLLEKPVGVTVRDAREIEAAALASGRAYGVMLNVRTHPCMRRMKEIVDSGEMGAIRRVHYVITDWTRGENYYHSSPWRETWKHDGGGVLLNQAPHNLDLLQWIGGMPASVHAFCGFGRWHDIEVEDDVTAYLEYANGATGTFVTCTGEAPGTNRLELSMDGGQLLFENGRLLVRRLQRPVSAFIRENTGQFNRPPFDQQDITPDALYPMHAGVTRAFARHILYEEPMIADGREGIHSLMLANAMLLSAWTGETVALPMDDGAQKRYEKILARKAGE